MMVNKLTDIKSMNNHFSHHNIEHKKTTIYLNYIDGNQGPNLAQNMSELNRLMRYQPPFHNWISNGNADIYKPSIKHLNRFVCTPND